MTTKQIEIVRRTWAMVTPAADIIGPVFYNRLFEIAPDTKMMFIRTSIPEQSQKLLSMMSYIIKRLDNAGVLLDEIKTLAKRHVAYGVQEEHYASVGEALLWTLEKGLSGAWTDEVKGAWVACYTLLSSAMMHLEEHQKFNPYDEYLRLNSERTMHSS